MKNNIELLNGIRVLNWIVEHGERMMLSPLEAEAILKALQPTECVHPFVNVYQRDDGVDFCVKCGKAVANEQKRD